MFISSHMERRAVKLFISPHQVLEINIGDETIRFTIALELLCGGSTRGKDGWKVLEKGVCRSKGLHYPTSDLT